MAEITDLLKRWSGGDLAAREELFGLVYEEILALARSLMRRERPGRTLTTTALAHEAYLRLAGQQEMDWKNRAHFYGAVAHAMRRVLVDQARRRLAGKRGGGAATEPLQAELAVGGELDLDILELNRALDELASLDPEAVRIAELRYILGLSNEEVAELLGRSPQAVSLDWVTARAWLLQRLRPGGRKRD
jgi:RNA polymerase sigma factor (TIGR02999 family)